MSRATSAPWRFEMSGHPEIGVPPGAGTRSCLLRTYGREARSRGIARVLVLLLGVALLAACADSDPTAGPGEDALSAEALRGRWTLTVPPPTSCSKALPEMALILEIEPFHVAGSPNEGERDYIAGNWRREGDEARDWLQGWLDLETGRVHLLLWQGVHVAGSVLDVRVVTDRILDGWLSEPIPAGPGGFAEPSEAYPGGFAVGWCRWQVTARR